MSKLLQGLVAAAVAAAPSMARADAAAATAAAASVDCTLIAPFYWEIGGPSGGPIVSGSPGGLWNRNSVFDIASASKWVFGAYVLERFGMVPPFNIGEALKMRSGYRHFNPALCTLAQTVSGCFSAGHVPYLDDGYDAAAQGNFFYGGGHAQYLGATAGLLNLGGMSAAALTAEVDGYLALGPSMNYRTPAIAAGLESSAADYAAFLQRLMKPKASGGYVLSDNLGGGKVATLPCAAGLSGCSPGGTIPFSYSFHHFVEDNATGGTFPGGLVMTGPGDGSFSSGGAYGFYPWITADKQYYGIIARKGSPLGFEQSIKCGQKICEAFLS